MPVGEPFIPERITVHLRRPEEAIENVTVSFPDYIKNVVSSKIYPIWPENAIRANIYVIVSFALNRIYTKWYPAQGYPFDITSSTQFDQSYSYGREIFENIGQLVDELFNAYIRRQGSVEPLFAAFCNGTTAVCEGLSQWGTVTLAKQDMTPYEILTYYYGNNIDIVSNVPVQTNTPSYPGYHLELGYRGENVRTIQVQLNRISYNYPAILKIADTIGVFEQSTQAAVIAFQQIFGLPADGVVNEATWYKIAYIFVIVKRLAELNSEGLNE
ncbi:MAG: peptidoglycan-binding protein [Ruminococcus sp.]|nr:peptidoglycan-binding protein [Ruminococcus sp.]